MPARPATTGSDFCFHPLGKCDGLAKGQTRSCPEGHSQVGPVCLWLGSIKAKFLTACR